MKQDIGQKRGKRMSDEEKELEALKHRYYALGDKIEAMLTEVPSFRNETEMYQWLGMIPQKSSSKPQDFCVEMSYLKSAEDEL